MILESVDAELAKRGFAPATLRFLNPNAENYDALLMQPCGPIEADDNGVRNLDRAGSGSGEGGRSGRKAQSDATSAVSDGLFEVSKEMATGTIANLISVMRSDGLAIREERLISEMESLEKSFQSY